MNIYDIIKRKVPASSAQGGEKIPWDEPEFSRRMLNNHLSQDHDWASRRQNLISRHVDWLAANLSPASRVLDLACGPGFYTQSLAALGHKCTGVDFSPASIEYARRQARDAGLSINYVQEDIRIFESVKRFDCVIFVFGEFNVFTRGDAEAILSNCARHLKPGGLLVVEGHTFEAVRETGLAAASWWTSGDDSGVLSARPHMCLQENFWDEEKAVALTRYYILDAESHEVRVYMSSMNGYSFSAYGDLFQNAGFERIKVLTAEQWPAGGPFEGVMTTMAGYKK